MEQFNEVLREVADETGCGWVHVYTPTKNRPNKPSVLTADGVHMKARRNVLVAGEILPYFAAR